MKTPPLADPVYFGPDDRPLFGWVHRCHSGETDNASEKAGARVVICNPFGYEAICSHRSLRHLAVATAQAGNTALRFDYDGTGDSAGSDFDEGRLMAWKKSIHYAIDALGSNDNDGGRGVFLLGVRLGALLAVLAAEERQDVAGIIAIAPVVSGRAYGRELAALQGALALPAPPPGAPVDGSIQEAAGYPLTAETKQALQEIDLAKRPARPSPAVLIIERDDMPSGPMEKWRARLVEQGADVEVARLPGYREMMLDPHKAVVPMAMVEAAVKWIGKQRPQPGTSPAKPMLPKSLPRSAVIPVGSVTGARADRATSSTGERLVLSSVSERAVLFGNGHPLFGILTQPLDVGGATQAGQSGQTDGPGRRGVVLLNAGSVHHVGPNRLYVALARRWAALGHVVLRIDISGIGDSPPEPGAAENVVYTPAALEDLTHAVEFVRQQPGVVATTAMGLCSGAYNAFKAAVAGLPIDSAVLINPLTFFWKPGMSLDQPVLAHQAVDETKRYKQSMFKLSSWKKLLTGKAHPRALARVLVRRTEDILSSHGREVARRLGYPLADDLGAELEQVERNHVKLRFVFAESDPGRDLLLDQGGSSVARVQKHGNLSLDVVPGVDHTFTPVWSHEVLADLLSRYIEEPNGTPHT